MARESAAASEKNAADAKERNLKIALGQIEKEFGKGSIMRLGDQSHIEIPVIPSGAMALDIAMGIGGFPRGRVIEIYGPESSGKTTVCLHVVANAQKAGGTCAYIDTEHALDPKYAKIIGVDTDNLIVSQPDCGEDALNIADTLVHSNAIDVLVIDSVAALVPRAEIEGQMGDSHVGLQARLMSQALRKLTAIIAKSNTCVIFTNQIREKIGVMFGNPETTTGGRALKFYATIRMEVRKSEAIKSGSDVIGNKVNVKIAKNKVAPPFKTCQVEIYYGEGISHLSEIINMGVDMGIIEKSGSWYAYNGEKIGQGSDAVRAYLQANPEIDARITEQIKEKMYNKENED
jgi:recombination protein RecA